MWFNFRFLDDALSQCDLPPTLYSIMESMVNFDNPEPVKIKDLSKYAKEKIFDFDYPVSELFDKNKFEDLFLKHYMFRRINYDTFTSFKLHLEVKLNDIMPKYNIMMDGISVLNFLGDTETHSREVEETSTNIQSSQSTSDIHNNTRDTTDTNNKFSDTPQDLIDDINDDKYVSEYTRNNATSSGESNSNSSGTNNSNTDTTGNTKELITIHRADSIDEYKKYLDVMNNIYSMIFKECDSLFYGII